MLSGGENQVFFQIFFLFFFFTYWTLRNLNFVFEFIFLEKKKIQKCPFEKFDKIQKEKFKNTNNGAIFSNRGGKVEGKGGGDMKKAE